jgi:transcriptional regulator with XRE-family HTH domain
MRRAAKQTTVVGIIIGRNIRQAREAAGYGAKMQGKCADLIGVRQPRLSDWERGRFIPEITNLLLIARVIGVTIDSLVAGVDADYDIAADARRRSEMEGTSTFQDNSSHNSTHSSDGFMLPNSAKTRHDSFGSQLNDPLQPEQHQHGEDPSVPQTLASVLPRLIERLDLVLETIRDNRESLDRNRTALTALGDIGSTLRSLNALTDNIPVLLATLIATAARAKFGGQDADPGGTESKGAPARREVHGASRRQTHRSGAVKHRKAS